MTNLTINETPIVLTVGQVQGPPGINGVNGTNGAAGAPGPSGPSGNAQNITTVAAFQAASFDVSTQEVNIQGYYATGDQGAMRVMRVASAPTYGGIRSTDRYLPNGSTDATNGGYWIIVPFNDTVNVMQFGAKGDDTGTVGTDDYTAFANMLAYAKANPIPHSSPTNASAIRCYIPAARYYISTTITIDFPVIIEGAALGAPGVYTSRLRFPAATNGLIFTIGAAGSSLQRLGLTGVVGDTSGVGNGVTVQCTMDLAFVGADIFSNDGFYFDGSGLPTALCDKCNVYSCTAFANGNSGFHMWGGDANVICFYSCNAIDNGTWGFNDEAFLGNTFVSCHSRDNGIFGAAQAGVYTTSCGATQGGIAYAVTPFRGGGPHPLASTTVPGTNPAVWYPTQGSGAYHPWVNGTLYNEGGSYKSQSNNNGSSVFVGCYHEGGQPVWIENQAAVYGGTLATVMIQVPATVFPSVYGGGTVTNFAIGSADGNISAQIGYQSQADTFMTLYADSNNPFRLKPLSTGNKQLGWKWEWNNIGTAIVQEMWSGNYSVANGGNRDAPLGNKGYTNFRYGFMLQQTWIGASDVNPSGTFLAGDMYLTNDTTTTIVNKYNGSAWVPLNGVRAPTTVAGLGSAATAGVGTRGFVTDATVAVASTTIGTTVVGGSTNKVPVFSDGTNWLIG